MRYIIWSCPLVRPKFLAIVKSARGLLLKDMPDINNYNLGKLLIAKGTRNMETELYDMFVEGALPDENRTPIDTVVEFVKSFNKCAKYYKNLRETDENNSKEIFNEARKAMRYIFNKYCTSKNRQYQRISTHYFFYMGTYNSSIETTSCVYLTERKAIVETAKKKNISFAKKYTLVNQGKIWKIDSVECFGGHNKWVPDIL